MKQRILCVSLIAAVLLMISCNQSNQLKSEVTNTNSKLAEKIENPTNKVILASEIKWEKLNPARGDQSPKAGTIWGDRNDTIPTGFLAKFVDGFSSPPHIHNVTYRAVVIKGKIHNDDPKAVNMWMGSGSFWTQPKGESHITAAKGEENIALVEIDKGPYLVKPVDKSFDSGELPINIDASNVVWLDHKKSNWIATESNATISFLWDDGNSKGIFVKLPKDFKGTLSTDGSVLHSVIIEGNLQYILPQNKETKKLNPGSSFHATDKAIHTISEVTSDVLMYIRTNGSIRIKKSLKQF
ncbi:DUF4437 domain-containing protein [Kordia algicida OT-1]|uniref:DUF4437 domain-containing protein n=1 Tax=Kordia algicida OT-1 TaxID=391587 RepID=A9E0E8_9FLAO|nr:DUF4437 domain-containing protein [Kordia algicida]EDP95834.1 hypothetical protein KAOT1_05502 [Kordia algicida OT-1]